MVTAQAAEGFSGWNTGSRTSMVAAIGGDHCAVRDDPVRGATVGNRQVRQYLRQQHPESGRSFKKWPASIGMLDIFAGDEPGMQAAQAFRADPGKHVRAAVSAAGQSRSIR